MLWQHVPQHFGECCYCVWLNRRPEVFHGDDPPWQELHLEASARPLLLFVWHGTVLKETGIEKDITWIPYNRMGLIIINLLIEINRNKFRTLNLYVVIEEFTTVEGTGLKM